MTPDDGPMPDTTPDTEGFDAEEALRPWVDMWNSYDLSQVDELFAPDSTVSYFSSEKEGAIIGIDDVREHHSGFGFVEGGKSSGHRLWLEDLCSAVYGPAAIVTGIWIFKRADGESMRGPVTFVYFSGGADRRLIHVHFGNYR